MSFNTPLTRLLGIRTPVVLAPMGGAAGGLLASQVHQGGGFGFLSPGYTGVESFAQEFAIARTALGIPTGPLPLGAGFLCWKLDAPGQDVALLDLALENGVRAVWLSFGDDIGRWVQYVRAHDARSGAPRKTLVAVQVNTPEDALRAAKEWNVDIVVAQGIESGGHGSASALPVVNLIPQVLAALPAPAPPVLAAGGLASGAHLAAFLALGAAGAVVGTRFLATPESQYADVQKRALLAARAPDAVRSEAFDELRGTLGWPAGVDGRALAMPAVQALEGGASLADVQKELAAGMQAGDPSAYVVWCGTGVGQISEIKPAQDVVRELHDDAVSHLRAAALVQ